MEKIKEGKIEERNGKYIKIESKKGCVRKIRKIDPKRGENKGS